MPKRVFFSNKNQQHSSQTDSDVSLLPQTSLDQANIQSNQQYSALDRPAIESTEVQPQNLKQNGVSLRVQLLRTVLPVVLIPLMLASAVGYRVVQQRTEERIQRQLEDQALLASEGTIAVLEELLAIPKTIATNPLVVNEALAGGKQAELAGLDKLPIEQVEAQYQDTKLLRTHRSLNSYLMETIETAEIAELLITERHGFNVAYSGSTTDFVQRDEAWWQAGKNDGEWIGPPDFDFAAKGFTIEVVQQIRHWNTGEFLGVVRAVLPTRKFGLLAKSIQRTGIHGSQRVQLIDAVESSVIDTFSAEGFRRDRYVIGGEAIEQLAAVFVQNRGERTYPTEAVNKLMSQYSLQNLAVNRLEDGSLTASFVHQDRQYKLVTIPRTNWVAISSIEVEEISTAGRDLLILFGVTALLLGVVTTGLILWLSNQLSRPIWNLAGTAKQVADGDFNVVADPSGTTETQTLAQTFNKLLVQMRGLLQQQETETRKAQVFAQITGSAAQDFQALQTIFTTALDNVRDVLELDRIILYQVKSAGIGTIKAASVAPEFPYAVDSLLEAAWISPELLEACKQRQVVPICNVFDSTLLDEQFLADLQVKASLVVPVFSDNGLFGLLAAHDCQSVHDWQAFEINCLLQLAAQLKLAIDRVTSLEQIQEARCTAEALLEEQRRQKEEQHQKTEHLQQQVSALISDIEGVAQGDLTVRADANGEIADVANFFNFTIERLQKLVTQVKQSAHQVNDALKQNEEAIVQLANEAHQQAEETTQTLESIEQMTVSMQAVAGSAQQAAEVAHMVSTTAQQGGARMNLTSQKILDLQATITTTAQKVEKLGKSSQNISQVNVLIREIASEISSLFDNATEASSEERRNFTFIAVKVGKLTTSTDTATRSIETLLDTIQQEAKQVNEAMEQVLVEMVDGAQLVRETEESLAQMLNVSEQIDDLAQSISDATASQVHTSQTIAQFMQQIAHLSERTSNFSHQLSEALNQTVIVAQELQSSVSTFNVMAKP
ncbi:GAF domain-containing protein [Phormidium tenue FACHB-886]|nr:GAF domain-containing protein [Phormidium tenue FACHB-886]